MKPELLNINSIRDALHDRNLSEVARKIGFSRGYLSSVRRGIIKNPSLRFMAAISAYLLGIKDDDK